MSETETVKGTLVELDGIETIEEACKSLCLSEGKTMKSYYSSYQELLEDELYEKYIVVNDKIYSLTQENLECENIFEARRDENGKIHFIVQFYNGGCGLNEAIGYAIENMDKK